MDTKYFQEALRNWRERNHDTRDFCELSPAEASEIMRDAQELKKQSPPPLPSRSTKSSTGGRYETDKSTDPRMVRAPGRTSEKG
jgi:hypothetical protein